MQRFLGVVTGLAAVICLVGFSGWAQAETIVYFVRDGEAVPVRLADYAEVSGTVAYQGPVIDDGGQNWKDPHTYAGVPILSIVEGLGGLAAEETLGVVAVDGWYKILPNSVVYGGSAAGSPVLATSVDGTDAAEWVDGPMLVFLAEDARFSNDDMLEAFGPSLSHYFGDSPSTTGMMVKGITYLVVNYDGELLPLPTPETAAEDTTAPGGVLLTVAKGETTLEFTLSDLEALDVVTAPGTFTNSAGVDYTATYTGVPLMTLVGNVPPDSTVRVTASDGYSMNYAVEMIADTSEGVWIVAFMENGEYMPNDPGPLRIVRIGQDNPHFSSSLSARMLATVEVLGTYEAYSLLLTGAVERLFARGELEAGIGCPCHTSTVIVTSKGETHTYTGLPLWRLIGYVDDDLFPAEDLGIHYNDGDFNDTLAAARYTITLVASDGYTQKMTSVLIARDDRFVIAFKMDDAFLDPTSSGYMRFVFDDSVELPEEVSLKSVKFLAEILVEL
jgi:hypothetical protein